MASGDESDDIGASTNQPGTAEFTLSSAAALDMTALQHQLELDNLTQSVMNTSSDATTSQKLVRALCLAQMCVGV